MSAQITVTLPDEVLQRAEWWARRAGRPVADLLADSIEVSLRPLPAPAEGERPLTTWSDEEVLAATSTELTPTNDRRLTELLDSQQAGTLAGAEGAELTALMHLYQQGLLRKAQAMREAVRRGLREPVQL